MSQLNLLGIVDASLMNSDLDNHTILSKVASLHPTGVTLPWFVHYVSRWNVGRKNVAALNQTIFWTSLVRRLLPEAQRLRWAL
jgi:hypothetical protein